MRNNLFCHSLFLLNLSRNSFVLAATDHLRQKITKLEARIHSLEDAIAIVHDSNNPHPVLRSLAAEEEEEDSILKPVAEEAEISALIDSLGMLHVDPQGAVRFFGPSGSVEVCIIH